MKLGIETKRCVWYLKLLLREWVQHMTRWRMYLVFQCELLLGYFNIKEVAYGIDHSKSLCEYMLDVDWFIVRHWIREACFYSISVLSDFMVLELFFFFPCQHFTKIRSISKPFHIFRFVICATRFFAALLFVLNMVFTTLRHRHWFLSSISSEISSWIKYIEYEISHPQTSQADTYTYSK